MCVHVPAVLPCEHAFTDACACMCTVHMLMRVAIVAWLHRSMGFVPRVVVWVPGGCPHDWVGCPWGCARDGSHVAMLQLTFVIVTRFLSYMYILAGVAQGCGLC